MTQGPAPAAEERVWRRLPLDTGSSRRHFALSDALARHARVPTLWWHTTRQPTLILGPAQRLEQDDLTACVGAGVRVVRRQAGGTAVYAAEGVLGLDVALPAGHPLALPDVVEAYRWLGEVWAEAVRLLGVEPKLVTVQDAKLAGSRQRPFEELIRLACFGTLSPYEVTARGRKLVGLAQVRRRGNVLLQSALHLRFDARSLATVLRSAQADLLAKAFQEAAIGLAEASGRDYAEAEVMAAVERSLARRLGVSLGPDSWTQEELLHAASHEAEVAVT